MGYVMNFIGWKDEKKTNGFLLLEMLTALLLLAILAAGCMPLFVQMAQNMRRGEAWEELSRQESVVEETMYGILRFSHDITVKPSEIRCRDVQNNRTGFSIKGNRVYRLLSDGSEQPVTGSSNAGMSSRIRVRPYGTAPYFSQAGRTIYISFLVYDVVSHAERPCVVTVVPIAEETSE